MKSTENELQNRTTASKTAMMSPSHFGLVAFLTAHPDLITPDSAALCPRRSDYVEVCCLNILMNCSSSIFFRVTGESSHYCQQSVDCYAIVIAVACLQCWNSGVGVIGRDTHYLQPGCVNTRRGNKNCSLDKHLVGGPVSIF